MKVLFAAVAAHGHISPMLPLADAFAAAGHDVSFATGADLCPYVTSRGHAAVAAGLSSEEQRTLATAARPADLAKRDGMTFALGTLFPRLHAPRMLPDLLAAIDRLRPDLIVHESGEFASPIAGTLRGVPWVHHSYGVLRPPEIQRLATEAMAPLWAEHGLTAPEHAGMFSHSYLDVCPSDLQLRHITTVPTRRPLQPAGTPSTFVLPTAEVPLVLVTFGTVFHRDTDLIAGIVRTLAQLPIEILVTTGPGVAVDALGVQADNVEIVEYVPLADVLPRCSAVVTHGGAGTVLAALGHGVPLVVVPQGADQFLNGEQVTAAGAGVMTESVADVGDCVAGVLDGSDCRLAAGRIAAEIATRPSAHEVAAELAAQR